MSLAYAFPVPAPERKPQESDDDGCFTLEQVGDELGLSVSGARQVELRALKKYRCALLIEQFVGREYAALLLRGLSGKSSYEYQRTLQCLVAVALAPDSAEAAQLWQEHKPSLDGLIAIAFDPDNSNGDR